MVARVGTRKSKRVASKIVPEASENAGSDSESEHMPAAESDSIENDTSASESEESDDDGAGKTGHSRKRQKKSDFPAEEAPERPTPEGFEENHLFKALSSREVAVADLALEWIESFEEDEHSNGSEAITELFNLVLRAAGCTHLVEAHDMINEDSAAATVAEISIVFKRQRVHEYPFVSTNKSIKHFRQNVQEFFCNLVSCGHEKGALYRQESQEQASSLGMPMVNKILAWLSALSTCKLRPLRFVSTVLLLNMQTQLCDLASNTTISLQKHQRKLISARNSLSGRNQRVQNEKIKIIGESIDSFTLQKNTQLEYIGDIFQHVFVNRYRDVDTHIRAECLRALASWMVKYEEMFLRADYLRYIGWLLSDPAERVRLEALKSLMKLFRFINGKREAMSIGFRQFTERFKDQFVNMVWKEKLSAIKVVLIEILAELFRLDFLVDADVLEVCSFAFYLAENDSSSQPDTKAKVEACKFISIVCQDRARKTIEPFYYFLDAHESSHFDTDENALSSPQCLEYKALAKLMEESYNHYKTIDNEIISRKAPRKPLFMLVDSLFRVIYTLPIFQGQWEGLIKYLLCDHSAIVFKHRDTKNLAMDEDKAEELVSKLEIASSLEKYIFMSFISAAVIHILTKEPPKRSTSISKHDDLNSVLPSLIQYIRPLEEYSSLGVNLYVVFLSLWNSILITIPTSIARLYSNVSDISEYNSVHDKVLHYYFDMTNPDKDLQEAFDTYFSLILKNFGNSDVGDVATKTERLMNSHIKMQVEDLLHSLATEGVDALYSSEPFEDLSRREESMSLPLDHKIVINRLLRVTPILQKFSQMARVINISRYVAEPTFGTSNVLVEVLQTKLVSEFDFLALIRMWTSEYTSLMSQFNESWQCVLEFILLSLSWKLEDLTYASNDSSAQQIDISLFLEDFNGLLISVGDLCVTVGTAAKEVNEIMADSNKETRLLIKSLTSLEKSFACHYIDILVSFRIFYEKFKEGDHFKNFELFFNDTSGVGALVKGNIPGVIEDSLKRVFLILESKLASLKCITLDRQDVEDVNYDDFAFQNEDLQDVSAASNVPENKESIDSDENTSSSGLRESRAKNYIWLAEKDLCVYTLKLFTLVHTGALSEQTTARLELNSKRFGGLFYEIIGVRGPTENEADNLL